MNIQHLLYFKTISKYENISKAAQELLIAQPALSKILRSLEEEVGVSLFDRVGKKISLNQKGQIFLEHTEKILEEYDAMISELDQESHENDTVRLSAKVATLLLPDIIFEFKKQYPEIAVNFTRNTTMDIDMERFDLVILDSTRPPERKNACVLLEEECLIALHKGHPLAAKQKIELNELEKEKFIIPHQGMPMAEIAEIACHRVGFQPEILMECDSRLTLFSFVEARMGVALVPKYTWKCEGAKDIVFRSIADIECKRYINLYWNENSMQQETVILFLNHLKKYFKSLTEQ